MTSTFSVSVEIASGSELKVIGTIVQQLFKQRHIGTTFRTMLTEKKPLKPASVKAGIYFVKVTDEAGNKVTKKVVKM